MCRLYDFIVLQNYRTSQYALFLSLLKNKTSVAILGVPYPNADIFLKLLYLVR